MARQDLLHPKPRNRKEDDLEKRKLEEVELLRLRKIGLRLLLPRSVVLPLLATRTSLPVSDGLKALALTRIVGIGIPLPVVISRQELA